MPLLGYNPHGVQILRTPLPTILGLKRSSSSQVQSFAIMPEDNQIFEYGPVCYRACDAITHNRRKYYAYFYVQFRDVAMR